jgi:thioesterase domain-containing protein
VHEVSGLDGYYSRLAEAIEPDIPIWGLLAVPEDRPQLRTIEAMAERLIRNIRSVQAEGPYRIAGYSFGGVLAYEAARQLSAAGHVVGFLGLIDTAAPEIGNKPSERQQTNAEYLVVLCLIVLDRGDDLIEHGLSAESREQTRQALRDLLGRSAALPLADVLQELRTMGAGPEEISDAPLEQIERLIGRLRTHVQALPDYAVPAAAVPTYLFAAQDTDIGDPWRGWGEVLQEPRHRRIAVPGNHQSIMGTHRAALGRAIMQALFSQRPA